MNKKDIKVGDTFALKINSQQLIEYNTNNEYVENTPIETYEKYNNKFLIMNIVSIVKLDYAQKLRYYARFKIVDNIKGLDYKTLDSLEYLVVFHAPEESEKIAYRNEPKVLEEIDKKKKYDAKRDYYYIELSLIDVTFFLKKQIINQLMFIGNYLLTPPKNELATYEEDLPWYYALGNTCEHLIKILISFSEEIKLTNNN